jgi:hypothetical protein
MERSQRSFPFAITGSWRRLNEPEEDVSEPPIMRNSKKGRKQAAFRVFARRRRRRSYCSRRASRMESVSGLTI